MHKIPLQIEFYQDSSLEKVGDPILAKVYANRGIKSVKQLDYSILNLQNPEFADLDKACQRLSKALFYQDPICIVGDYDVDGLTATVLVYRTMQDLGFKNINYFIPNRFKHGYGLSISSVDSVISQFPRTTLILTVDNGITAFEAVEYAASYGIDTVICDHHLAESQEIPAAIAVVNPNRYDCPFPSKGISGVGVAFYLMSSLRSVLISDGVLSATAPHPARYLDLVAIGTIADICDMDYNNRILVAQGLQIIRSYKSLPGLYQLMKEKGIKPDNITEDKLSFKIIPMLNALGRMSDMSIGVDLLLSSSQQYSKLIPIIQCNELRKKIQKENEKLLFTTIEQNNYHQDKVVAIEYHANYHPGILGILAAKARDLTSLPAIIFTDLPNPSNFIDDLTELSYFSPATIAIADNSNQPIDRERLIVASGRSILGINLKQMLDQINNNHPDLLVKYGGHAQALSVTIRYQDLEKFIQLINSQKKIDQISNKLMVDSILPVELLCNNFVRKIELAGPWGKNFESPIFASDLMIVKVKSKPNMVIIYVKDEIGNVFKGIKFSKLDLELKFNDKVRVYYQPQIEEFRGSAIILMINHLEKI